MRYSRRRGPVIGQARNPDFDRVKPKIDNHGHINSRHNRVKIYDDKSYMRKAKVNNNQILITISTPIIPLRHFFTAFNWSIKQLTKLIILTFTIFPNENEYLMISNHKQSFVNVSDYISHSRRPTVDIDPGLMIKIRRGIKIVGRKERGTGGRRGQRGQHL